MRKKREDHEALVFTLLITGGATVLLLASLTGFGIYMGWS
jgi:aminoglycoside N3'-acetyltransferase